jgi:hypothetical protein
MPYFGQVGTEHVTRPAEQVERDQRLTAYRVDVGQRVGRGDPAEGARVVDDRSEEVHGRHDRSRGADPYDGSVVSVLDADQQVIGPVLRDEPRDRLLKLARRDLARAAAAVRVLSEPDGVSPVRGTPGRLLCVHS